MAAEHRLVLYCLLLPAAEGVLEEVRAHYAATDPRVEVIIDRRKGQRRSAVPQDARPERRGVADRRRFTVARRLAPLPEPLAARAGHVRWIQRTVPVSEATEAMTNDEVVAAVRRGNPEAPTELYWRFYQRMHSRLCVLLGNPHEADGVVVTAFGRLLDVLDDRERDHEDFEQLLYEQVDAAAAAVLEGRDGEDDVPVGGLAVTDPDLDEAVRLGEWDPDWPARARAEGDRIAALAADHVAAIEHVGGTSLRDLAARPTIDLLAGADRVPLPALVVEALEEAGYEDCGDGGTPGRQLLRRRGRTRVDLHVVEHEGPLWEDTLRLRDYLRRHPAEALRWATVRQDAARTAPTSALRYQDLRRLALEELLDRARRDASRSAARAAAAA